MPWEVIFKSKSPQRKDKRENVGEIEQGGYEPVQQIFLEFASN